MSDSRGSALRCDRAELHDRPSLAGTMRVRFTLTPGGSIDDVTLVHNTLGPELGACVSGAPRVQGVRVHRHTLPGVLLYFWSSGAPSCRGSQREMIIMKTQKSVWMSLGLAAMLGACGGGGGGSDPAPQLGWEDTQYSEWVDADGLIALSTGATFALDASVAQAGTNSVEVTCAIAQNPWGTDKICDVGVNLMADGSTVDFTSRTITAYFRLGTGTDTVNCVEVMLIDAAALPSQGKYQCEDVRNGWLRVSYEPSDPDQQNYVRPGFDITQVQSVTLRISVPEAQPEVASAEWNFDSISW